MVGLQDGYGWRTLFNQDDYYIPTDVQDYKEDIYNMILNANLDFDSITWFVIDHILMSDENEFLKSLIKDETLGFYETYLSLIREATKDYKSNPSVLELNSKYLSKLLGKPIKDILKDI
jgi:hypothetical protein